MDPLKWKTLGRLAGALIAAGVLCAGLAMPVVLGTGLLAGNEAAKFLNTTCDLQESPPPEKTYFYARDGKTLIATIFSQDRQPVPLSQVPTYLQQALVATEDRRFYQHHGVDLRGLIRSAVSTGSGDTQGGSTLTMQYVKQIRYFQASEILNPTQQQAAEQAAIAQNLTRKMQDAQCALYIENVKKESKATILDNYLNIAFFGENSYGIQTAAQTYFGKNSNQLTLAESALLVGLLRAPTDYDPFVNPSAALQRRNEVLQNLVAVGKLSQQVATQQESTPIVLSGKAPPKVEQGCANASSQIANVGFFCSYVQSWLSDVNGISLPEQQTGGYKVITTLDPNLQNSAQAQMNDQVGATASTTAVLPAVDPATGDILAMAASKTFGSGPGQTETPIFSNATAASGASTFKLFPLLTALSTGIPSDFALKTIGNTGTYPLSGCATAGSNLQNGDANVSYNAVETLASATAKSDNTYFAALPEKEFGCHLQPIVDMAQKLGITALGEPGPTKGQTLGQSIVGLQQAQQLVLGSVPVSALQLAGAYAAVADNGLYHDPSPILSITDSSGTSVNVKRSPAEQVVQPQVAQQAVQILIGDTTGVGTSHVPFAENWYNVDPSQIAGKTGTADLPAPYSGQNGTVWFVGMTPNLVAAAGLINFDSPSTPNSGILDSAGKPLAAGAAYGDSAALVWVKALSGSLKGQNWTWPNPSNAKGIKVPDLSGQSPQQAAATLQPLGLTLTILGQSSGLSCGNSATLGSIGYYGPSVAPAGSAITACLSTQIPVAYSAPVVTIRPGTPPGTAQPPGTTTTPGNRTTPGTAVTPNPGG